MNKFLEKNINKIVLIFLILGPILDLATSLLINKFDINFNYIIILKIIFMIILMYYTFFVSKNNKKEIIYLILVITYLGLFSILIVNTKDLSSLIYEFQNLIRVFYFPIILVSLFSIYKEKLLKVDYKILSEVLIYYLALILIPLITNTGFDSYAYSKTGSIGWFNSTNEIGGIISILLPFLFIVINNFNKKIVKTISFFVIFIVYFSIGSKVPVIALSLIIVLELIRDIINFISKKEYKKIIVFSLILIMAMIPTFYLIPKSSFYKNIIIHLEFLEIDSVDDLLTISNVDHFVFSSRLKFMKETKSNYEEAGFLEKLIGIGYIEKYGTDEVNVKLIEMDYYDIFYRNGLLGFLLFFYPLISIINSIIKKLLKINISNIEYSLVISLILIMLLALFSGHILTSPSVSIYVAVILLYFKEETNEKLLYNS